MKLLCLLTFTFAVPALAADKVKFDYPKPTDIKEIIYDVAKWDKRVFIFGRDVSGKIVATYKAPLEQEVARQEFRSILDQVGLTLAETKPGIAFITTKRFVNQRKKRPEQYRSPTILKIKSKGPISFHHDKPTDIKEIIYGLRKHASQPVIMGRNISGKLLILNHHRKLPAQDVQNVIEVAFAALNLGVQGTDNAAQVLPLRQIHRKKKFTAAKPQVPLGRKTVSMSYEKPTSITKIIDDFSKNSNVNVTYGRNVSGKVQILAAKDISELQAFDILLASLNQLGLGAQQSGASLKIMPLRRLAKLKRP